MNKETQQKSAMPKPVQPLRQHMTEDMTMRGKKSHTQIVGEQYESAAGQNRHRCANLDFRWRLPRCFLIHSNR